MQHHPVSQDLNLQLPARRWAAFRRRLLTGGILAWFAGCLFELSAIAQFSATPLKTFCASSELGMEPRTALTQGSDGSLYGTTLLGGGTLQGTIFKVNPDGTGYRTIHRFTTTEIVDGTSPYGGVIEASDGLLYGTTYDGGHTNRGTLYRLNKEGGGWTVLHRFTGGPTDGANAYGGLVEGSDGTFYGTTFLGGSANRGVVFAIQRDGAGYRILKHFTDADGDASQPTSGLIKARDGMLYGTTYLGGSKQLGTVFRLKTDGTGFSVLRSFVGTGGDGTYPFAGLTEGADGLLYGTTTTGGVGDVGTVFKLRTDGSGYEVLHQFATASGSGTQPFGGLVQGADGTLFGTTSFGGTNEHGTVFRLGTNGTGYTVLRRFEATGGDASVPYAGLVRGADGALYGTTVAGGVASIGTIFRLNPDGGGYRVIHGFAGPGGEAASPYAGLIEGRDGALYGTSYAGGLANRGAVFRLNRDGGGYLLLHSFDGENGASPYGALLEARNGVLYGTTLGGGLTNLGTIFKLNKDGTGFAVLHHFSGAPGDGMFPYCTLIEGTDGQLYGTTGGAVSSRVYGTVFKMGKDGGGFTTLHTFIGEGGGGTQPYGGVIEGPGGWLYGTTAYNDVTGPGTVFRINSQGVGFVVLHAFTTTGNDGAFPFSKLVFGSDGLLYGTTFSGGTDNRGTVFTLNTEGGGYQVLRRFTGVDGDGTQPAANAPLVEGSDGALYGVTNGGGATNLGTIFRLNRDGGDYRVIRSFLNGPEDGAFPYGGLVKGSDGAFYGTTQSGGVGCGRVFRLAPEASLSMAGAGKSLASGPAGFRLTIQYQDSLALPGLWKRLADITLSGSPVQVVDPGFGTSAQRFYRALLIP